MIEFDRRHFLTGIGVLALGGLSAPGFAFQAATGLRMWHSPGCGCCLEWGKRIEAAFGRKLIVTDVADMAAVKRAHGVPAELQSCHTALIHDVVVEGHVPPEDIRRLIRSGNPDRAGLAVPGMPVGAPGMDVGHNHTQPYKVYAFTVKGVPSVFATHGQ